MFLLQRKFRWSRWYLAAMLFALGVTGGTGFGQQESYLGPPGQLLQTSAETRNAIEFDSLLRRLDETEHRLRSLEARQGSLSDKSAESVSALHSASQQTPAKEAETKKPEAPKEKKWFDNYSLRGYAQFRYNYVTQTDEGIPNYAGDSSIGPDNEFLIRRARLIFTGNITDHLRVYLQPDFASTPDGAGGNIEFCQIRDWYGDVFLDKEQVHRFRVGQSKVPYGWENLQSSQNRLYLDRNDAFNSAVRNERDLGIFYYWTPEWATDLFKILVDEGLKGSGNYGLFGIGVYNGQGGSIREVNDNLHVVSRLTLPWVTHAGQIYEAGIQGYTGQYVVRGSAIRPLGAGATGFTPVGTIGQASGIVPEGTVDKRLGLTFIRYPQPFGFQAEWTVGEGPALNAAQTAIETRSLQGGYVGANYKLDTHCWGTFFPFARYQHFEGGYKSANNAPYSFVNEWDIGIEWQIRKEMELVVDYIITDRTNLTAFNVAGARSYGQFDGDVLRFQFQVNY
jgi:phosphate-selective porin